MSVMTKVLVLLVAFAAVALTALVTANVANQENFRAKYESQAQAVVVAKQDADLSKQALAALQGSQTGMLAQAQAELSSARSDLTKMQTSLAAAEARAQEEASGKAKLEGSVSRLAAHADVLSKQLAAAQDELGRRRTEVVDSESKAIKLADRNNELNSQLEALARQVRLLSQQMVTLQEDKGRLEQLWLQVPDQIRNSVLGQGGSTAAAVVVPNVPTGKVLSGSIDMVQQFDGATWVQISLGKNDGVQPQMEFRVHRGDQFLGKLVIWSADETSAAGKIELQQGAIQKGDRVQTGG